MIKNRDGAHLFSEKRGRGSFLFLLIGGFSGSADLAQGVVEVEASGGGANPGIIAEGSAAVEAELEALDLLFGEGLIDVVKPVAGDVQWPGGEKGVEIGVVGGSDGEGAEWPVLGTADEIGSEGVAFDVAAEGEKMFVPLDGEGFEAILIEVAIADGVVGGAPAHGVGVGEPAEEGGELAILLWPDDEMPVGGHEAEGKDGDGMALVGFLEGFEEGVVVGRSAEHDHTTNGAVEDVINQAAGSDAGASGHGGIVQA